LKAHFLNLDYDILKRYFSNEQALNEINHIQQNFNHLSLNLEDVQELGLRDIMTSKYSFFLVGSTRVIYVILTKDNDGGHYLYVFLALSHAKGLAMIKILKPIFKGMLCGLGIFIITHVAVILRFLLEIPGAFILVVLPGVLVYFFMKKNSDSFALTSISIYATLIVIVVLVDNSEIWRYLYYLRYGVYTRCGLDGLGFALALMLSTACSLFGYTFWLYDSIKNEKSSADKGKNEEST